MSGNGKKDNESMSYKDIQKEKQVDIEEITRKVTEGNLTHEEYLEQVSVFDKEMFKSASIRMTIEGKEIVIYPDLYDEKDESKKDVDENN